MRWVECEHCLLVTTEIERHLKIAHHIHKGSGRPRGTVETLDHLRVGLCFYCGEEAPLTSDHVIPMRMGQHFNRRWNRVPCCQWCNQKKGGLLLGDWLTRLAAPSHNHPKYKTILARCETIVTELLSRPELAKYPSWIGAHLLSKDAHENEIPNTL